MDLQEALHECRISYEHLKQRAIDAQAERDRLLMQIGSIQNGNPLDEVSVKSDKDFDLVKSYLTRIQELEGELVRIQSSNHLRHENSDDFLDSEDDGTHSRNLFMDSDIKIEETDDVVEDVEKELEHSSIQEELDRELKELDKRLEQKEAEMKRFASGDTSVLKQHYEKKAHELEHEKRALQKEIEDLRHNLSNISSSSDDSAQKLKEEYRQKLNVLEKQVAELKKKQDAQAQLLRQKQKSDEAAKRLQDEIQRIKTQKVQLQHKIKQESEQFRHWKASREKEVLQLKKEGRRNEYEMHKLLAHNQRQKLVTIVDDLVVEWLPVNQQVRGSKILGHINPRSCSGKLKKLLWLQNALKDLLDSRKASREQSGAGSIRGPGIPALVQTIEHELEVTIGVHEVRTEYERQMKERAKMAEEIARLKVETLIEKHQNFRCQLRDREVDCREKDSENRELKEKVVNLVRQLELKQAEFNRQETLMKLALERQTEEKSSGSMANNSDGHAYDLRPKGSRNSTILDSGLYVLELPEAMDTSYDQQLYSEDAEWVHPTERKKHQSRKRNSNTCSCSKKYLQDIEM